MVKFNNSLSLEVDPIEFLIMKIYRKNYELERDTHTHVHTESEKGNEYLVLYFL